VGQGASGKGQSGGRSAIAVPKGVLSSWSGSAARKTYAENGFVEGDERLSGRMSRIVFFGDTKLARIVESTLKLAKGGWHVEGLR